MHKSAVKIMFHLETLQYNNLYTSTGFERRGNIV